AHRIHQADRDAIAGEGVANKPGAVGIWVSGKGVEDCGERAIGIKSPGKIAGTLQICWQRTDGRGGGALTEPFVAAEEKDLVRAPDRPREISAKLVALKNRLGQTAPVIRPGVRIEH